MAPHLNEIMQLKQQDVRNKVFKAFTSLHPGRSRQDTPSVFPWPQIPGLMLAFPQSCILEPFSGASPRNLPHPFSLLLY